MSMILSFGLLGVSSHTRRVSSGHAARERVAVARPFERRDRRLQRDARRIARAPVVEALVLAHGLLGKGGSEVDRRDDRSRERIGVLAGVDRARGEPRAFSRLINGRAHRASLGEPAWARNASASDRVIIPIGCPWSSTITAGDSSKRCRAMSTVSPLPTDGSGGPMI